MLTRTVKTIQSGRFYAGEFGAKYYSHIYAIAPKDGGCIKFGQTLHLKSRFSSIQTGSPVKLKMLGSVFVPIDVELGIHEHLKDYRSHGEWFLPTMEAVAVADLIREKRAAELLIRVNLFKMVPEHMLEKLNFNARMSGEKLDRADTAARPKSSLSSVKVQENWDRGDRKKICGF